MQTLGIITARGGSKGFPRKNLALLGGRPLLTWTCDAAVASRSLDRVVLSTDDAEIAEVGRASNIDVPFLRPAELALDTTPSAHVVSHALSWLRENEDYAPDVVVLLQPTSPLRTARHIDEAIRVLETSSADTVVSVVEVPHRYSPFSIMQMKAGRLVDFWDAELSFDRYRRQEHPQLFARNGPAVLVVRTKTFLQTQSFYGGMTMPYLMTQADSVDVDHAEDLQLINARLNQPT